MIRCFWLLMSVSILIAGCANGRTTPTPTLESENPLPPTLDISRIPRILPTVPPSEVMRFARLADETILEQGQTVYDQHCAGCHGLSGEGQFPDAPLQPDSTGRFGAPPHNADGHTWHHDDDLLLRLIREGGSGDPAFYEMPAFGEALTAEQIETVLAFIKSMWTEDQRLYQAEITLIARRQS